MASSVICFILDSHTATCMECVMRENPYPHPLLLSFFHTADPFRLKVSFTLIFLNVLFFIEYFLSIDNVSSKHDRETTDRQIVRFLGKL